MKRYFLSLFIRSRKVLKSLFNPKIGFLLIGLSTTIWFLVRVIPKPQRAAYPCMRAAAPILSSFVVYLLSLFGSIGALRYSRRNYRRAKYLVAIVSLSVSAFLFVIFFVQNNVSLFASESSTVSPNMPVGIARGIFPGRVVWVFNPNVSSYDGETGFWWSEENTSQTETDKMLKESLISLTGTTEEKSAWDALFKYFNAQRNHISAGYTAGQKIAIKINQNNTSSHSNSNNANATPQLIFSLLRSLINEAGIPPEKLTVFDASRFITDNIFEKCHAVYPEVIFVDNKGGNGRVKATYADNAIPYSVDNGALAKGIATCAIDADYLINMALLRGHPGQGTAITLCGKNYFGALNINSDWSKNAHVNFGHDPTGKDLYIAFVDYMGHKDLGEKTMLFMIDGIYGTKTNYGIPTSKWKMQPFNNGWSSSLFLSQDEVAIDAVGLDFLRSEWPDMKDIQFSEKYLEEAAQADNPPSKTFYDPEGDGVKCKSLGVMESWNNAEQKQYSRNLGKDYGIELSYIDLSIPTKVTQFQNQPSVEIYPNPAHDKLFLKNCKPNAVIQIFSLRGNLILNTTLSENQIDLSKLKSGGYVVKIIEKENSTFKQLIKQ